MAAEKVVVSFNGTELKAFLQGSWQSTALKLINRNLNRAVTKAYNSIDIVKLIDKDQWIGKGYSL